MYTDISEVIDSLMNIIQTYRESIDSFIKQFVSDRKLTLWKGLRTSLPDSAFPAIEFEPTSASPEWFAVRAQMPTYNVEMTITTTGAKEPEHLELITGVVTMVTSILTDPRNLQLKVLGGQRYMREGGVWEAHFVDSFVSDANYVTAKEGTFRVATMGWWGKMLEPYPDSTFIPPYEYGPILNPNKT